MGFLQTIVPSENICLPWWEFLHGLLEIPILLWSSPEAAEESLSLQELETPPPSSFLILVSEGLFLLLFFFLIM